MKKIRLLLLLFAMVYSLGLQAKDTLVKNATALTAAFNAAQDGDTVSCAPGYYNVSNTMLFPVTGIVTLRSQYPGIKDSMAIVAMNMGVGTIPNGVAAGIIFESIHLQHNNPTATSGHIIYFNKKYATIAKLVFRNCEISNGVRGLFRSTKPDTATSCGDMNYLEMTNCLVHNTFVTSGNAWPLLYLGHLPVEVNISNNTFYDMPYMKNILAMGYANTLSGRNAKIVFKNNTVCTTMGGNAYISTANYLGEETEFTIENNVFILPNWSNSLNQPSTNATYYYPCIVRCNGGIITGKNNMIQGPRPWLAGQTLDVDGLGGFNVIDTIHSYTMDSLIFTWADFADPEKADYSFFSTKKLATSGVGGAPIGDPRWVKTFTNPRILSVSYSPDSIAANVTPRRAYFEDGATVKVSASVVDGYKFKGWKKVSDGSSLSTDNPYTFTITSDMDIQAEYSLLVARNVSITLSGSTSASYTITPQKAIYYEGDVITIALNKHYINDFLGWSDSNTDLTRTITIAGDVALTANFSEHPYYLAWDFHQLTANNQTFSNLAANHASNALNPGVMNYVKLDTIRTISTRNNKFTTAGKELAYCLARKTLIANFSNPDYMYIKFSTIGLSKLKVKSAIATDNSIFKVQKMQYSLDRISYVDFATDTISAADTINGGLSQKWMDFEGVLPTVAENKDSVLVRWIADATSERLFANGVTTSDGEYCYISKIIVMDNTSVSKKDLTSKNTCKIYAASNKLYVNTEAKGNVEVYTVMGLKIKEEILKTGLNEFTGLKSGIYIVKVGSQIQKVIMK